MMKSDIHILGMAGTFMAGLALLAREAGHQVSGYDRALYPPMSTQLEQQGIACRDDCVPYDLSHQEYVIGNALSRGHPFVEAILNQGLSYTSGPAWLAQHVLSGRHVIAISGTHGKSTTSSLVAWLLEACGHSPGFLIGAIPNNFSVSARLGTGSYFVIEADEYDTAFFDKQSKFLHYKPRTLLINNLEYDHADIFPDVSAIIRQFHLLVRTVAGEGHIIVNAESESIATVLQQGIWTPVVSFGLKQGDWQAKLLKPQGTHFEVWYRGVLQGEVRWNLIGNHNVMNALAALAVMERLQVDLSKAIRALADFSGVKRRLEHLGSKNGISLYDDFAHHPTAIEETIAGMRAKIGEGRLCVLLECRSNTMKMGVHRARLASSLQGADKVWIYQPQMFDWDLKEALSDLGNRVTIFSDVEGLTQAFVKEKQPEDSWVLMSNGDFSQIRTQWMAAL